jgi:hypothetical protein
MTTAYGAINMINLILLRGLINAPRYPFNGAIKHAGDQSLIQQNDGNSTLRRITISSTTHIGGAS